MRITTWALVAVLTACGTSTNAASFDCPMTLDAFCASNLCARSIDPMNVVPSFCKAAPTPLNLGVHNCRADLPTEVDVVVGNDQHVYYYDATTHQLVAVLDEGTTTTCLGGPGKFQRVSQTCKTSAIGYGCPGVYADGGTD